VAKHYADIVPLWIRIVLIAASFTLAVYWMFTDSGLAAPIASSLGSPKLGFLISWLVLLVPILGGIYGAAWLLYRRRAKQDFPTAIARDRER
jgi:hypothetical protein